MRSFRDSFLIMFFSVLATLAIQEDAETKAASNKSPTLKPAKYVIPREEVIINPLKEPEPKPVPEKPRLDFLPLADPPEAEPPIEIAQADLPPVVVIPRSKSTVCGPGGCRVQGSQPNVSQGSGKTVQRKRMVVRRKMRSRRPVRKFFGRVFGRRR